MVTPELYLVVVNWWIDFFNKNKKSRRLLYERQSAGLIVDVGINPMKVVDYSIDGGYHFASKTQDVKFEGIQLSITEG